MINSLKVRAAHIRFLAELLRPHDKRFKETGVKINVGLYYFRTIVYFCMLTFGFGFTIFCYCYLSFTLYKAIKETHMYYSHLVDAFDTLYMVLDVMRIIIIALCYILVRVISRYGAYVMTKLCFPASNWSNNYHARYEILLEKELEKNIVVEECNDLYAAPEWYYDFSFDGIDVDEAPPVLTNNRNLADNNVVIAAEMNQDVMDILKEKLPIKKKMIKKSVATNHILNDAAYKGVLGAIEALNFSKKVVVEVGGHKGSLWENSIRVVTDMGEGDGIRMLGCNAKARNEIQHEKSFEWFFCDFFDFVHKADVVICVFVMGMDMLKFFAHCHNLGVQHIVFTTAATSNFIKNGFMCTTISEMLTVVEGDEVLSYFNESDKIYKHSLTSYFIPLFVGNIAFKNGDYYRREPVNNVDSNMVYLYTLCNNEEVPLVNIDNTINRGIHEDFYAMVNPRKVGDHLYCYPLAIPTEYKVEIEGYLAKAKSSNRIDDMVKSVNNNLVARYPLQNAGGFVSLGNYIPETTNIIVKQQSLNYASFVGFLKSVYEWFITNGIWTPYEERLICTPESVIVKSTNITIDYNTKSSSSKHKIKKEADYLDYFNSNLFREWYASRRTYLLANRHEADIVRITDSESSANIDRSDIYEYDADYFSWFGPDEAKTIKVGDKGDALSVLINGGAHIKFLYDHRNLDIPKLMRALDAHSWFALCLRGHWFCSTKMDESANLICYDGIKQEVIDFPKDLVAENVHIVDSVTLFHLLFLKGRINFAEEQCYRVAWGIKTVETPRDDDMVNLATEFSNLCFFYNNMYYSSGNDFDNMIIIVDNHAYSIGYCVPQKCFLRNTLNNVGTVPQPAGIFKMDIDALETMRVNYKKDIDKIKRKGNQVEKGFKESIINYFSYETEHEIQWLGKLMVYTQAHGLEKMKSDGLVSVYDNYYNHMCGTLADAVQDFGWDGKKYVVKRQGPGELGYITDERYVFVSEELSFLRALNIRETLQKFHGVINQMRFDKVQMIFVNGVPGCGKTYTIANACKTTGVRGSYMKETQMILTASVGGKKAYEEYDWIEQNQVRTYDSIIINYESLMKQKVLHRVLDLYCDEAMMAHFGQILVVIALIKPKRVKLYGDTQQIPFINRVVGFVMTGEIPHSMVEERMVTTYRSPSYMSNILQIFYPEIKFVNYFEEEKPEVFKIKYESVPPYDQYDVVLTFTQFEKALLKERGCKNVYTIHEMQGSSHEKVAITRFVTQDNIIYQSAAHIVVAVSRHKKIIHYYTVDIKDTLSTLLVSEKIDIGDKPFVGTTKTFKPLHIAIFKEMRKFRTNIDVLPGVYNNLVTDYYRDIYEPVLRCDKLMYRVAEKVTTPNVRLDEINTVLVTVFEEFDFVGAERLEYDWEKNIPSYFNVNLYNFSQLKLKTNDKVYCVPQLKTPIHPVYKNTIGTLVFSIMKRNANPPVLLFANSHTNYISIAHLFMDVFIDKGMFESQEFDYENNTFFRDWWGSRDMSQKATLIADSEKYFSDAKRYNGLLKQLPKPVLNNSHNMALAAPQVITSMQPLPTAYFAQYMKAFMHYLKASLKSNWHINDGLDGFTLSALVNNLLAKCVDGKAKLLETDISKFDKSQELGSLLVVSHVMRFFKLPEHIINDWEECHIRNFLVFKQSGISLYTDFQRRSGDILTFIGNTIVAMCLTCDAFDLKSAVGGVFGGDDSLVVFPDQVEVQDTTSRITNVFNFMTKVEHFPSAVVFASKFMLYWEGVWVLMPDALKVITKLGRDDIRNKEHASLYYKSFREINSLYCYESLRSKMALAIVERYKKQLNISPSEAKVICDFIGSLINNSKKFLALYKETSDNSFQMSLPQTFVDRLKRENRYKKYYDVFDLDML